MGFSAPNNLSSNRLMWWSGVGIFVCAICFIALGVFDPQPHTFNEMPMRTLMISAEPHIEWQDERLETVASFSRRVMFQLPTEPEIAVGIVLDDGERPFIISATNSGFVQIVHGNKVILPEQTWPLASVNPYVRGGEAAEFWIDVDEENVTVHINRELLWKNRVNKNWKRWGIFSDGFGNNVSGILVRE